MARIDKVRIGNRKIKGMAYGNFMIELGVLNNQIFWNADDELDRVERELIETTEDKVSLSNTVEKNILDMYYTGVRGGYLESFEITDGNSNSRGIVTINRTLDRISDAVYDKFTVVETNGLEQVKGKLEQNTLVGVIDGNYRFASVQVFSDYSVYKISGRGTNPVPPFLLGNLNYSHELEYPDSTNSHCSSELFKMGNTEGENRIYVNNGVFSIRIANSLLEGKTINDYFNENPIRICFKRKETLVEYISITCDLKAYKGSTVIITKGLLGETSYPKITVYLPRKLNPLSYASRIISGLYTLNDVPKEIQEEVKSLL